MSVCSYTAVYLCDGSFVVSRQFFGVVVVGGVAVAVWCRSDLDYDHCKMTVMNALRLS